MPEKNIPMTMSGFCQFGPGPSHEFCIREDCTCKCHEKEEKDARNS